MSTTTLVIASYNQPNALALVLEGVLCQRHAVDQIVFADDGSTAETKAMVDSLRSRVGIRVVFTSQEDRGFRKAKALNNALREATGDFVLFLDGDCIPPPDWAANFIAVLERGADFVTAGYVLMDAARTRSVEIERVRQGCVNDYVEHHEVRALRWRHWKEQLYRIVGRQRKPKILGGNWAAKISALRAVNGFDERFDGFTKEDSDIRNRLRNAGFRGVSAWDRNWVLHCSHEIDPARTAPGVWRRDADMSYYRAQQRSARCELGLMVEVRERRRSGAG